EEQGSDQRPQGRSRLRQRLRESRNGAHQARNLANRSRREALAGLLPPGRRLLRLLRQERREDQDHVKDEANGREAHRKDGDFILHHSLPQGQRACGRRRAQKPRIDCLSQAGRRIRSLAPLGRYRRWLGATSRFSMKPRAWNQSSACHRTSKKQTTMRSTTLTWIAAFIGEM